MAKQKNMQTSFSLTHEQALVLFELLSRWGSKDQISNLDDAEKSVLQTLSAKLERQLDEPFHADYDQILAQAKQKVL